MIDSVSELVENYESWNCEERFQRCGKHWNGMVGCNTKLLKVFFGDCMVSKARKCRVR